jgi:hypothetical protein
MSRNFSGPAEYPDPVEQEERLHAKHALARLILRDPRTEEALFERWDRAAGVREWACKVRDAVERLAALSSEHAAPAWRYQRGTTPSGVPARP